MPDTKTLISGGNAWTDSIPDVPEEIIAVDTFAALAAMGPANKLLIQITGPGMDALAPSVERNETEIAAKNNDPRRWGHEVYSRQNGVRLDLLVTNLEANGFVYEKSHSFHNPRRPDPTLNITFSRQTENGTTMPAIIRNLLTNKGFNGFFLHANVSEAGQRTDCINCFPSTQPVKYGAQLLIAGPANGGYDLKVVQRPRKEDKKPADGTKTA